MGQLTTAIKNLIIINILFFVASKYAMPQLYELFSMYFPKNEHFGIWQFVTHMFMHANFMHILFNMYALWAFGSPLEQMWGSKKFLFFYFSAGLGAAAIYTGVNYFEFNHLYSELTNIGIRPNELQQIFRINPNTTQDFIEQANTILRNNSTISSNIGLGDNLISIWQTYNTPAVGASGAIYGVLVAFGMAFPNAKLALIFFPVPISAKYFIPILIGLDLFSGVTGFSLFSSGGGVAHFAHVGGAIIGFIMMKYWQHNQFKRWD